MQGSFSAKNSVYNTILNHIRKIREMPQSVRGIRYTDYSDGDLNKYLDNIQQVVIDNRYHGELPMGLGKVTDSNYFSTPHLDIPVSVRKNIISGYKIENKEDFRKVMALSLAYIASGNINDELNKETYICDIIKALRDYQIEHKIKFSPKEKAAILHNVNLVMGLESYIFMSDGKPYVLMESEEFGASGMKQKSYTIVNMDACACAIFKFNGIPKTETRIASQVEFTIEKAQQFVEGKLELGTNGYDYSRSLGEDNAKQDVREKFSKYLAENPSVSVDVVFENSFKDYCLIVKSPAIENTQEKNGYEWK